MQLSWRQIRTLTSKEEQALLKQVKSIIESSYQDAASLVRQYGYEQALSKVASTTPYHSTLLTTLSDTQEKVVRKVSQRAYNEMIRTIPKSVGINLVLKGKQQDLWSQTIQAYLGRNNLDFVAGIDETTRNHIVGTLQRGMKEGWTTERMENEILSSGVPLHRASTIVRTEITRASSIALLVAADSIPYVMDKVWITSDDERVRGASMYPHATYPHTILHEKFVDLYQSFYNGQPIRFPGDPKAHPSNTINCRCTLNFRYVKDSSGKAIPRTPGNGAILDAI
jgi:uncharacterized protein with gpF-like domain